MANPIDLATSVAQAIDKVAELTAQVLSGHEVRKLKYNVEAARNYVFVDEKVGEYRLISDATQKKLKLHFRKQIFDD